MADSAELKVMRLTVFMVVQPYHPCSQREASEWLSFPLTGKLGC